MKRFLFLFMAVLMMAGTAKADVEWTIWEGNESFDFTTGGSVNIGDYCRNIKVGDILSFEVSLGENDYHQEYMEVKSGTTGWKTTVIADWVGIEGNFSQEVTQTMYDEIVTNTGEFNVGGKDYTLTKVSVCRTINSIVKTPLVSLTENGSFDGSKLSAASASEGDYIYAEFTLKEEKTSGTYQLMGNSVNSSAYTVYDKLLFPLTAAQVSAWTASGVWPWSNLGENIKSADIYLLKPINSFSIGSIGYATFSASQEVTAPNTVKAYKATVSSSSVVLSPFTNNVIPANTGAIIAGDEGSVLEFVASSTGSIETSELIACTTATDVSTLTVSGYDLYVLYPGTAESETELSLSTLLGSFGGWNSDIGWDSSTYTVTYSKATTGSEGGWVGKDWSGYDYLRLNFSSNTLNDDATFYVAYQGHDENTTQATLAQGTVTTVNIPLDSDYKNSIGNFSMYSNATSGSLTFKSAALIDSDGAKVAEFRKTTSGTLAANKAYLKLPSGSSARLSIVFNDDDSETTGVLDVQKHTTQSDNVYYNLRGMQVDKPTKGLYIMNGKKVIVK